MSGFLAELLSEFLDLNFIGVAVEFATLDFAIPEFLKMNLSLYYSRYSQRRSISAACMRQTN